MRHDHPVDYLMSSYTSILRATLEGMMQLLSSSHVHFFHPHALWCLSLFFRAISEYMYWGCSSWCRRLQLGMDIQMVVTTAFTTIIIWFIIYAFIYTSTCIVIQTCQVYYYLSVLFSFSLLTMWCMCEAELSLQNKTKIFTEKSFSPLTPACTNWTAA